MEWAVTVENLVLMSSRMKKPCSFAASSEMVWRRKFSNDKYVIFKVPGLHILRQIQVCIITFLVLAIRR